VIYITQEINPGNSSHGNCCSMAIITPQNLFIGEGNSVIVIPRTHQIRGQNYALVSFPWRVCLFGNISRESLVHQKVLHGEIVSLAC
jgi:hypothetical protein